MTNESTLAVRIEKAVISVTEGWAKQRKAEERKASARENREARLHRASDYYNFRSAAEEVMAKAYLEVSDNGKLPALARQIMYRARGFIQEAVGQPLDSKYFTQTLLPDYIRKHGCDWDIVFDDRGHFTEPHTKHEFGVGTLAVREYIGSMSPPELEGPGFRPARILTSGPEGVYSAVLFVEKEGFRSLFEAVHLAERHDLSIMSTKGLSVTAARTLIEGLVKRTVKVLALHDFDKAGFSIVSTLSRNTRRYTYEKKPPIIDLGLRLSDVRALDLEAFAETSYDHGSDEAKRENLRLNGANPDEIKFLVGKKGPYGSILEAPRRVELNALTTRGLIAFIEDKLQEHGIGKVVPKAQLLADAYKLYARSAQMQRAVEESLKRVAVEDIEVPENLAKQVAAYLKRYPEKRWNQAVKALTNEVGLFDGAARRDG
jgi:hypothetical protein